MRQQAQLVGVGVIEVQVAGAAGGTLAAEADGDFVARNVGGAGIETADVLRRRERPLIRRGPHVGPGVLRWVVKPDRGAFHFDAAAPLVAVPERAAGEVDEAAMGAVEGVGAVDAANAGGRGLRKALFPEARFEVIGKKMESLRDAVVPAEMQPFLVERIICPRAFPAKRGRRLLRRGALLDPFIFRMARPIGAEQRERKKAQQLGADLAGAPGCQRTKDSRGRHIDIIARRQKGTWGHV